MLEAVSKFDSAKKAIKNADDVFAYAESSGTHFSISKALALTIARKAALSENFRVVDSGSAVTLYI